MGGGRGRTTSHGEMKAFLNIKLAKKLTLKGKQATVTAIIYYRGREGERENMNERKWEQVEG